MGYYCIILGFQRLMVGPPEVNPFTKKTQGLVACFFAAVLPVNYIALDFAVVLPTLHPTAAPRQSNVGHQIIILI